mmetsp:Transcript_17042/g.36560  ORF Transcript_17042/g.36560 Transcript_17042/m.36560 type:complete len:125 (-) Transcript_17042:587-961(-)
MSLPHLLLSACACLSGRRRLRRRQADAHAARLGIGGDVLLVARRRRLLARRPALGLTFDEGSPRVLDLKSAQIRSDAPLLISIAYPANTGFTIVASAASWCHSSRTCSITFRKVDRRAPTPLLS